MLVEEKVDARRADTWIKWTPETAVASPELVEMVEDFDAGPSEAGVASTRFLQEEALDNHGSTITRIMVWNGRVEGFYALCSASVELRQSDRKRAGGYRHAVQPASLIAWMARDHRCDLRGPEIVMHAFATARRVAADQGSVALVLDPFDAASEAVWLSDRYAFRRSATEVKGIRRLWMPLQPS